MTKTQELVQVAQMKDGQFARYLHAHDADFEATHVHTCYTSCTCLNTFVDKTGNILAQVLYDNQRSIVTQMLIPRQNLEYVRSIRK